MELTHRLTTVGKTTTECLTTAALVEAHEIIPMPTKNRHQPTANAHTKTTYNYTPMTHTIHLRNLQDKRQQCCAKATRQQVWRKKCNRTPQNRTTHRCNHIQKMHESYDSSIPTTDGHKTNPHIGTPRDFCTYTVRPLG